MNKHISDQDIIDLKHIAKITEKDVNTILALDLGTKTGYAVSENNHIISGTMDFKGDRFEGGGMRYLKFKRWLNKIGSSVNNIDAVFFEEVRRHAGVRDAHAYGAFFGILTAWCEANNLSYLGVPVGTIKKFITGKGNANKAHVIKSIQAKGHSPIDDNEADALALMYYAKWAFDSEFNDSTQNTAHIHNHIG